MMKEMHLTKCSVQLPNLQKNCLGLVDFLKRFTYLHCFKSVQIRSFSGRYIPIFGLNTEIYSINLRIQSEYGKIRILKRLKSKFSKFAIVPRKVQRGKTIEVICDCNRTQTHNHLVHKRKLNPVITPASLGNWLSVRLQTKWLRVRISWQSLPVT